MVSLSYIMFVNLPYGKQTLDFIYKNLLKGFKICCGFCLKNAKGKLPI